MIWKAGSVAVALMTAAAAPVWAANPATDFPRTGCDPEYRIDGSTAAQAKKKFEAAGYTQVHILAKGCDNFWHAIAARDGEMINVVLSPEGTIVAEGN